MVLTSTRGSGLRGLRGQLAAVDGHLQVQSALGAGATRIATLRIATLPIDTATFDAAPYDAAPYDAA